MLNTKLHLNESIFTKDVELNSTREGFGKGIAGLKNEGIIVLSADLSESLKLTDFIKKYPKRFIQCGIAEQNMAGIAAGLAMSGKIPFMTSFACFSPSRNWDQIRVSVAQQNTNVKIVGSHSGFSPASDGRSAQAFEDIALMRVLPNIVIVQPTDYEETVKAVDEIAKHKGPVYLRLSREKLPDITKKKTPFEIGKGYTYVEGEDVTLISSGPIMVEVLHAAKDLKSKHSINAEVISIPTISPIDKSAIFSSVEKTQRVVTIEEHQVIGGLGSAVCELLSEHMPTPVLRIGMSGYGETGTYKELLDKYELSSHHIVNKVLKFIK